MQSSARLHISGCSTLTNLLDSKAKICEIVNSRHPHDILSLDFAKAFDKTPHRYVIDAATSFGICDKALEWLLSILACRKFNVLVGDALSATVDITSGIIQGSTLGPALHHIFIDSTTAKNHTPFSSVRRSLQINS